MYCCDLCIPVVLLAVYTTNSIVLCAVSGSCSCSVYTSELCVVVLISYVRFCTIMSCFVFALMVLSAFLPYNVLALLCCTKRLLSHLCCSACLLFRHAIIDSGVYC